MICQLIGTLYKRIIKIHSECVVICLVDKSMLSSAAKMTPGKIYSQTARRQGAMRFVFSNCIFHLIVRHNCHCVRFGLAKGLMSVDNCKCTLCQCSHFTRIIAYISLSRSLSLCISTLYCLL